MAKTRYGVMPCEGQNCESHSRGAPVVVFANERGTLSYSCDWCGRAPYARPGTGQHAEWMEAMEPPPEPATLPVAPKSVAPPTVAPAPVVAPPAAAAPKSSNPFVRT